ncbi:hypothetical protein V6N11_022170 [Hibiscus sabdariffa]|uniref:Uncharacterized protein n=1 Tax=Hibiscus sabdariffa TaxID=183260 RepID=A0ABR2TIR8_9ROSI
MAKHSREGAQPRALQVARLPMCSCTARPAGGGVFSSCCPRLLTRLLPAEYVGPTDQAICRWRGPYGREHLLSDDEEELNAIGTHFRDRNEEADNEANTVDENAVNEEATNGIGDNEADGADESETEGNEACSVDLSTSEETDYLGSLDVGSYEIDSDGDFVSRKTTKNKRANYKFVGKYFISKIRIVHKLRLVDMMRLGREELNVELNKQLCSRANKWAEEKIKGNITHEFNRLFDYVLALRTADPNGSFDFVVQRPTAADIPKFRRLYVCFGALKVGFKRYCRPVIGVN